MADIKRLQGKLVNGINFKYGCSIVLNSSSFHRKGNPFPIVLTKVSDTYVDEVGDFHSVPLYGSSSQVFVLYYLRDLLRALDGLPPVEPEEAFKNSKNFEASRQTIKEMVDVYGAV